MMAGFRRLSGAVQQSSLKSGTATFTGDAATTVFNIAHGLGVTPKFFEANASSVVARALFHVTATASNIVVTFAVAPAAGANNIVLTWLAMI